MKHKTLLAYFGHHRCATTWITNILRTLCDYAGLRVAGAHNDHVFFGDLNGYVSEKCVDFLFYSNADYEYVRQLGEFRGFHVVRDPRDVVVSSYFAHLYSHPTEGWPELAAHKKRLQAVTKDEGLKLEMAFRQWSFNHMLNWNYDQPRVLELKMEALTQNPLKEFLRIFDFLGILDHRSPSKVASLWFDATNVVNSAHRQSGGRMPLHFYQGRVFSSQVEKVVKSHSFEKLSSGRQRGQEDIFSHYRKGTSGDWLHHFSSEHIKLFKNNFNDLLIKLGYECEWDW